MKPGQNSMTRQIATSENRINQITLSSTFSSVQNNENNVYTRFYLMDIMDQGQIIGLKKKLKKNNDDALDFVQKLESTITDFEKTGNLSGSYSEIKKAILEYKDKLLN